MELGPIISTLRRHKTAVVLIIVQIAVACAILCNAVFLIGERVQRMREPSGIDESHLVMITGYSLNTDGDASARIDTDLAALRNIPGVQSAMNVGQFPFASNSWNTGLTLTENQASPTLTTSMVTANIDFLKVTGLRLLQGRWFEPGEMQSESVFSGGGEVKFPSMVVTRTLADTLFPGGNALGKVLYGTGSGGTRIVGIVADMLAPGGQPGDGKVNPHAVMFLPAKTTMGWYVLRTDPEQRARVMKSATNVLETLDNNRILQQPQTIAEMRNSYFSRDRAVTWLLTIVSVLLLTITAFGIGGLASFWVAQRTKQIGVRRALGATQRDILRYFQTENFVIVTIGVVLGMALAFGLNQTLMSKYELPRLPWFYLPVGAISLWLLGQLAVLSPALRASRQSPATATRNV